MGSAYQNLTQRRLNGLALFAREGMDAYAETVRVETGVNIGETDNAVLRQQVQEYVDLTRVRDYSTDDLWRLVTAHRRALEALSIIDARDVAAADNKERAHRQLRLDRMAVPDAG